MIGGSALRMIAFIIQEYMSHPASKLVTNSCVVHTGLVHSRAVDTLWMFATAANLATTTDNTAEGQSRSFDRLLNHREIFKLGEFVQWNKGTKRAEELSRTGKLVLASHYLSPPPPAASV
jgi:hypothetical protein